MFSEERRNVREYIKCTFWNVDFIPGISLIIQLNL
jgi:hypothetical protein